MARTDKRGRSEGWQWKSFRQRRRWSRQPVAGTDAAVSSRVSDMCHDWWQSSPARDVSWDIWVTDLCEQCGTPKSDGYHSLGLSGNLAHWSMHLWHIFLTQDQVINCVDVVVYPCSSRSSAVASSRCRTGVSKFSPQFIQSAQTPTFIRKLCNKFFRSVTYKNVKIFYQNSIIVTKTHVYVKALSATSQRGTRTLGADRIK